MLSTRFAAAVSVLCLTSACAQETICGFSGRTIFPEIEAAKAAFLGGDYARFLVLTNTSGTEPEVDALIAPLVEGVPDGFAHCTTVLQREDVGGLVQEVTVLGTHDGKTLIALYLQSAPINGSRKVVKFAYNSSFDAMLDLVR